MVTVVFKIYIFSRSGWGCDHQCFVTDAWPILYIEYVVVNHECSVKIENDKEQVHGKFGKMKFKYN